MQNTTALASTRCGYIRPASPGRHAFAHCEECEATTNTGQAPRHRIELAPVPCAVCGQSTGAMGITKSDGSVWVGPENQSIIVGHLAIHLEGATA